MANVHHNIAMSRVRVIKMTIVITVIVLLILLAVYLYSSYSGKELYKYIQRPLVCTATGNKTREDQANVLAIFTGRWKFLRISLPYIYRELRVNSGVLDRVIFMMVNYDNFTYNHLLNFVQIANHQLNSKVFEFNFMGYSLNNKPPASAAYGAVYYEIFEDLMKHPYNRYFKADDDIVYIHPGTFRIMIERKNSCQCFMHFANIVTNWRSNIKHQEMGVYDNTAINPKKLKFESTSSANCGYSSLECAELTLRTFLHYYHRKQLDKYMFSGRELLVKREHFSINLHMLDMDLINMKALLEVGPIPQSDEHWWLEMYARKFKQPNCIIGESLVVHFAYKGTHERMIKLGLLREFERVTRKEVGRQMDKTLWDALEFKY